MLAAPLRTLVRPTFSLAARPAFAPRLASLRGYATKRFTPEHEYVAFDKDSNVGTVGITDYAQKSLGDVVFVELPAVGSAVKQGEQIGAVESVKAASDIYAPVGGEVTEVNEALNDAPNLLNKAAETDGWLCKIRLTDPKEFDALLAPEAYEKLTEDDDH